jgi:hypothetical protein
MPSATNSDFLDLIAALPSHPVRFTPTVRRYGGFLGEAFALAKPVASADKGSRLLLGKEKPSVEKDHYQTPSGPLAKEGLQSKPWQGGLGFRAVGGQVSGRPQAETGRADWL